MKRERQPPGSGAAACEAGLSGVGRGTGRGILGNSPRLATLATLRAESRNSRNSPGWVASVATRPAGRVLQRIGFIVCIEPGLLMCNEPVYMSWRKLYLRMQNHWHVNALCVIMIDQKTFYSQDYRKNLRDIINAASETQQLCKLVCDCMQHVTVTADTSTQICSHLAYHYYYYS